MLLREPHLWLAVPRLRVTAESVLGVTNAVPRHLGEVGVGEPGLEHHRARVDLHPVRMEVLEALRRRDGQGLRRRGIVRPPGRVHPLARRHHRRDPAVHVRIEKVHGLLPRRVIPQHHMTMRVDQPRNDRRSHAIDHYIGPRRPSPRRGADRGDSPVLNENRLSLKPRRPQNPGRNRRDVHQT